MTKKEMMQGTIEYMELRIGEMLEQWEELEKISKERELTKREEERMETLAKEQQTCRHILEDTQLYMRIKFPEEVSDEEAHAQVSLEMEMGREKALELLYDKGKEISLKEWAEKNGIASDTARRKAQLGRLRTARKVGRDWLINENEKNRDGRKNKKGE